MKNRGTAHVACNLTTMKSFSSFLLVALHNLIRYDAHLHFSEKNLKKTVNRIFIFFPSTDESMRHLFMEV